MVAAFGHTKGWVTPLEAVFPPPPHYNGLIHRKVTTASRSFHRGYEKLMLIGELHRLSCYPAKVLWLRAHVVGVVILQRAARQVGDRPSCLPQSSARRSSGDYIHGMLSRNSFLFADSSPQTEGIFNGGLYVRRNPGCVMGVCYTGELSSTNTSNE